MFNLYKLSILTVTLALLWNKKNDFGDVSIDARLMTGYQPESIVELNNGCIF